MTIVMSFYEDMIIISLSYYKVDRCLVRYSPRAEATMQYHAFFHHYQGSIDFNTVNIHRTVGMYFLVSTGNRGDIE